MISVDQFRVDFPAFADNNKFPKDAVNYWINFASLLLNPCRWGPSAYETWPNPLPNPPPKVSWYDIGVELVTAHNLVLEAQANLAARKGGIPGMSTGPVASRSVDKVSISNDVQAATEAGGGNYNLTVYGTRLLRLARMAGAGPIQVGIGRTPPDTGGAYWGPLSY